MKMKLLVIGVILIFCFNLSVNAVNVKFKNNVNLLKDSENNPDYLLITSEEFKNYRGPDDDDDFQDLVDYHQGYDNLNSEIVTTEYIDTNIEGNFLAEKIRNYIAQVRPEYVLLGGDTDTIPGPVLGSNYETTAFLDKTPSDLYYSCPDTIWSSYPTDMIPDSGDLSPDSYDAPDISFSGAGFLEYDENNEDTDVMKWNYVEGSTKLVGWCNITFEQSTEETNINWISFKLKTHLREYPRGEDGSLPQDLLWWSFRLYTDDGHTWYRPHLMDKGTNSEDWETFNIPVPKGSKSFLNFRFYRHHNDRYPDVDLEMDPGDHVLIDKLYFYDYDPSRYDLIEGPSKPSICIGRACVDNSNDIKNFTSKTLKYIRSSYPEDGFIENVMLVDSHREDDHEQGTDQLLDVKNKVLTDAGYSFLEYYKGYQNMTDARDYLYNQDNTNLLLYTGHGTEKGEENFIYNRDVEKFKNTNPFFEYSTGCSVGALDYGNCYAEKLTVKTKYGAFAGLWHTRTSWTGYYPAMNKFFEAICDWDYTIGQAHKYQLEKQGGSFRYTFTLFGDPAVNLKMPKPNNAPSTPEIITESVSGKAGESFDIQVRAFEDDNDIVYYGWDWNGDGEVDKWYGEFNQGEIATISHTWNSECSHQIRVKAKDSKGMESDWSDPIEINIETSRFFSNPFFERLSMRFSNLIQSLIEFRENILSR